MGSLRSSFPGALGTESARCRSRTSLGNVQEPSNDEGHMEIVQCPWWVKHQPCCRSVSMPPVETGKIDLPRITYLAYGRQTQRGAICLKCV